MVAQRHGTSLIWLRPEDLLLLRVVNFSPTRRVHERELEEFVAGVGDQIRLIAFSYAMMMNMIAQNTVIQRRTFSTSL